MNLKKIFYKQTIDEKDAIILEQKIKSKFLQFKDERIFKAGMRNGKRWGGDTECFYFKAKNLILMLQKDIIVLYIYLKVS